MKKLVFVTLILGCLYSCKQGKAGNKATEIIFPKETSRLTEMKLLRRRVDFGKVSKDTTLIARYDFVNTGNDSLRILYVAPDCSCTGNEVSKPVIAPHDSAYILLKMDTKGRIGPIEVYSTVAANTSTKLYSLQILADVVQ